MKDVVIPILIVIAVIAGGVLFGSKAGRETDDIDKMQRALTGINTVVRPGAQLSFDYAGVDKGVAAYHHLWIRYALAPAYIAMQDRRYDTVLLMCRQDKADSMQELPHRTVLWQSRDSLYSYILTKRG